jgi:hypothetical protein
VAAIITTRSKIPETKAILYINLPLTVQVSARNRHQEPGEGGARHGSRDMPYPNNSSQLVVSRTLSYRPESAYPSGWTLVPSGSTGISCINESQAAQTDHPLESAL